jgi:RND family efflux transporter MFP subunit
MKNCARRFFLTIPLAIVCASCSKKDAAVAPAQTSQAPVTVSTVKAQVRDLSDRIELTGQLTPDEQVTVYAKVPGYLKTLRFDIGGHVRQGELIAELEVPEMADALTGKRAVLAKAQAALEMARAAAAERRAEADFAQINYRRLKSIHDRDPDVLPGQDVDQARAGQGVANSKLKSTEAQIKGAEAEIAAADAEIGRLKTLIAYSRIEAPMTGIVTRRFVDPGVLIQAAPVVTIARVDRVRALVDVPESAASFVRTGSTAVITVDGADFPARVARTGGVLDPASRTLRVEFDVSNPGGRLRPGMTAKLSLELRKIAGAVTVPVAAIHAQGSERTLFVMQDGRARLVKVKTGLESPDWIQIAGGLRGGEEVIVASAGLLVDGTSVSVRP